MLSKKDVHIPWRQWCLMWAQPKFSLTGGPQWSQWYRGHGVFLGVERRLCERSRSPTESEVQLSQLLNQDVSEAHWLPLACPNPATPLCTHQHLASNTWKKKFQSLPPDTHNCSHKCPQARAAFVPANYRKMFTPKIKDWKKTPTLMAV
eukprot:1152455-Pelagomonas_calceolata.AAC.9